MEHVKVGDFSGKAPGRCSVSWRDALAERYVERHSTILVGTTVRARVLLVWDFATVGVDRHLGQVFRSDEETVSIAAFHVAGPVRGEFAVTGSSDRLWHGQSSSLLGGGVNGTALDDCATAPVALRPPPIRKRRTRAIAYYLCDPVSFTDVRISGSRGLCRHDWSGRRVRWHHSNWEHHVPHRQYNHCEAPASPSVASDPVRLRCRQTLGFYDEPNVHPSRNPSLSLAAWMRVRSAYSAVGSQVSAPLCGV
jgi:hypothetical protein